jgi:hypothetical protein
MDDDRSDPPQPSPHSGVDGLGYTGRPAGDDEPTAADDEVAGLGFGGRAAPDEYDGDRFSGEPNIEPDVEPDEQPDATPDEDAD